MSERRSYDMNRGYISISLRIEHPERDLSILCTALGLIPDRIWKKGEVRKTPTGNSIGGVNDKSYCSIRVLDKSSETLSNSIQHIVSLLAPHREILAEMADTGGVNGLFIGWFCDEHSGDRLDRELLISIVDLSLVLDLNIYIPDQFNSQAEAVLAHE